MSIFNRIKHGFHTVEHGAHSALNKAKDAGEGLLHDSEHEISVLKGHIKDLENQLSHLTTLKNIMEDDWHKAESKVEKVSKKIASEADVMVNRVEGYFGDLLDIVDQIKNEASTMKELGDYIDKFKDDVLNALKALASFCAKYGIAAFYDVERFIRLLGHYIKKLAELIDLPGIVLTATKKALDIEEAAYKVISNTWKKTEKISIDVFKLHVHGMHGAVRYMKSHFEEKHSIQMPELPGIDRVDELLNGLQALPVEIWEKVSSLLNLPAVLDFFQKVKEYFQDWKQNNVVYDSLLVLNAIGQTIKSFVEQTKGLFDIKFQVGLLDFLKALIRGGEDSNTLDADADANTGAGGTARFKLFAGGPLIGAIILLIVAIPLDIIGFMLNTHGAWIY